MLEADQLSCDKGDRPLFANLSFSLPAGQCLHVQGDNGAGKTSLLRILAGLAQPAAGVVRWCGQVREEVLQEFRAQTLYFGHLPAIKSELSALENLRMGLRLAAHATSELEMQAALDWAGLKNRAHQAAGSLSAGQKRRINLALMKLRGGQLWVLDEPTTSLDVRGCELLQGLLTHHLQTGGALVLTSHVPVNLPATQVLSL
jgi:heme exporter protein A